MAGRSTKSLYLVKFMRPLIILALAAVGCASVQPAPTPSVVGTWLAKGIGTDGSPDLIPICEGAVQFRADGTTTSVSGEQFIQGRYFIQTKGSHFVLSQRDLSGNGAKNCQGLTSDFVIRNTVPDARLVVTEDTLKLYPPIPGNVYFALSRKPEK